MGQGLQVWDENGVNLVDTNYRLTQIIGSVYTPDLLANNAYLNGSVHVPQFAGLSGTKFVHHIPYFQHLIRTRNANPEFDGYASAAASSVRIEGNYVKWVYKDYKNNNGVSYPNQRDYASLIIWGVF